MSLLEPLSQEQSDFGALALAALGRIYEDTLLLRTWPRQPRSISSWSSAMP